MNDQRWLSLTGICGVLQMTEPQVLKLVKRGFLVSTPGAIKADKRYLDPTPEYANKLRMCESLYSHTFAVDLDGTPLLTIREVAQIMGWTLKTAHNRRQMKKIPGGFRVASYTLYPVASVRELLWKKQGRKINKQRDPFLIEALVRFFMARKAEEESVVPSDADFLNDDLLQKKFRRVLRLPPDERSKALQEVWRKVELAKKVATALASDASSSSLPA